MGKISSNSSTPPVWLQRPELIAWAAPSLSVTQMCNCTSVGEPQLCSVMSRRKS
jgi:hypothetical protein